MQIISDYRKFSGDYRSMKKLQQFNILAFKFDRLKNNGFKISITPLEAERNEELISLADNELLRAIRRLTNHRFEDNGEQRINDLFVYRKKLTKQANSEENRKKIREINNEIRNLLFIPEIISITTQKKRNYPKIGRDGFWVNGKHYRRLMCSAAMARTNRALFCADYIYERIDEVLRCDCKPVKLIPAKWNAYYSLMSSAAFRVSTPRVCVVKDLELNMVKTVDWTIEDEHEDKIVRMDKELPFNIWDGMGLISPELAKVWSEEVGYDGIAEAFIVRAPFIKGLLATFDFHKFADEVTHTKIIKDIYGKEYNADDIDVILTESQFKLWNAYDSIEDHAKAMEKYGLRWGVTRIGAPEKKNYMRTNYQFVQVLNMNDDDIAELCQPTIDWIKGVAGKDYAFKLIYLLGKLSRETDAEEVWNKVQDPAIKALMLEPDLLQDSYLSDKIIRSLNKKIRQAYIGKLILHGNINFAVSDPYALAEYVFGMDPKGLLNEFEHYAGFWGSEEKKIVALRSPLTWRAEVTTLNLKVNDKMKEWYKYIPDCIVFNIYGVDRMLLGGQDFDGDIDFTTDNLVFNSKLYGGNPVTYQAGKATKEFIENS